MLICMKCHQGQTLLLTMSCSQSMMGRTAEKQVPDGVSMPFSINEKKKKKKLNKCLTINFYFLHTHVHGFLQFLAH